MHKIGNLQVDQLCLSSSLSTRIKKEKRFSHNKNCPIKLKGLSENLFPPKG